MNKEVTFDKKIQLCKQLDFLFMDYSWTEQQWQDLSPTDHIIITNDNIGFCLAKLNPADHCADLLKIAVNQETRERGIARSLLRKLFEQLRQNNYEKLFLEVNTDNQAAISLYQNTGARMLNTVKSYYSDGGDCYRMFYQL